MDVVDDAFYSIVQSNGTNRFTLTTRLAQMLPEIETLFGQRDLKYTLCGIELFDSVPHVWFPMRPTNIVVRLNYGNRNNLYGLLHELAHEVVHLLDPVYPPARANYLEEGMATWYSADFCGRHLGGKPPRPGGNYGKALEAYEKLHAICPTIIKDIRATGVRVNDIRAERLVTASSACPKDLAEELCATMP